MIDIKMCRNCGDEVNCNKSPLLCDSCIAPFEFRLVEYEGKDTSVSNLFKYGDPILGLEEWEGVTRCMIEMYDIYLYDANYFPSPESFVIVHRVPDEV